jgi:cbb3-type cytochrome oxidase cytochrome c subunit
MKHISTLALCGCVVGALALSSCGSKHHEPPPPQQRRAQSSTVDPALAERGRRLFVNRGCNSCHTIGRSEQRTAEGPDLAGVTDRRTNEWLVAWLKNPDAMFGSDPVADAMLEQFHGVKMPNMHLHESEITAIIAYLAQYPQR